MTISKISMSEDKDIFTPGNLVHSTVTGVIVLVLYDKTSSLNHFTGVRVGSNVQESPQEVNGRIYHDYQKNQFKQYTGSVTLETK